MKKMAIVVNPKDNVATALKDLTKGSIVAISSEGKEVKIKLCADIPFGHKFALVRISKGEKIIKYGEVMGKATAPINAGEHAHVHNIESQRGRGDLR
jgi:altronate dehydratase small subunit